jgi:hypothetical protein
LRIDGVAGVSRAARIQRDNRLAAILAGDRAVDRFGIAASRLAGGDITRASITRVCRTRTSPPPAGKPGAIAATSPRNADFAATASR